MEKHASARFAVALAAFGGASALLLAACGNAWPSWAALAAVCAGLALARATFAWSRLRAALCWAFAAAAMAAALFSFRPPHSASVGGSLAREAVRAVISLPNVKAEGLLKAGVRYAGWESRWEPPEGYTFTQYDADGLPLELLEDDGGRGELVVLQLHGGAYAIGFMDVYRDIALKYSRLARGVSVLSVDYRIAPDNHYPAALEDALAAWEWLMQRGYDARNVIVAGDSAGGNLALALTLKLRDAGRALPRALVLMSPWADMTGQGASYTFNFHNDPMFGSSAGGDNLPENAYADGADLTDPCLSPVFADYTGFPPMLIQVGGWEMLLSDSRTVAASARGAGADVTLTEYDGMFHMFQLLGGLTPESRRAWAEVEAFLLKQFGEP